MEMSVREFEFVVESKVHRGNFAVTMELCRVELFTGLKFLAECQNRYRVYKERKFIREPNLEGCISVSNELDAVKKKNLIQR